MFKSFKNGLAWCFGAYVAVFIVGGLCEIGNNYEVELKCKNTDKESE